MAQKPAFTLDSTVLIKRAGFPGAPIDTPAIIVEVKKGTKRGGYDHRYKVITVDGKELWAYESDLVYDTVGEFRRRLV